MIYKKQLVFFFLQLLFCVNVLEAGSLGGEKRQHLYFGPQLGYGSTTWDGLVPGKKNQGMPMSASTPIRVEEGGGVWGLFGGFEFTPNFALEGSYMHYPDAKIVFDPETSLLSFWNNGLAKFDTHTETISMMAKLMLPLENTVFRIFSAAGVAAVHRDDYFKKDWLVSPSFSVGLNYALSQQLMLEFAGNYTAGYGDARPIPSDSYYPFLYSGSLRLAYRF